MNRTGKIFQQQLRDKQARDAVADLDIAAVQRAAHERGRSEGFEAGYVAGWDALAAHLVETGVLDSDEPAGDDAAA
jgi:hypothetical protein